MYYFDLDSATPETPLNAGGTALTVSAVIFDTLQTDARWTIDSTGYNFRHTPGASNFASGDRRYRIEYVFDPVSGENFALVYHVTAMKLFAS